MLSLKELAFIKRVYLLESLSNKGGSVDNVSPYIYIYYTILCLLTNKWNAKGDGGLGSMVQRILLFLENPDPVMVAKLQSKTHVQNIQNTFFDFLSRFLRVWLQILKSANMTKIKKILEKNLTRYQKTQNFMLISNLLKSI